ncbi:hypothetical protein D3C84_1130410 [compost metagenome]
MAAGQFAHQGLVQGFDEAHVDHRGVQALGHLQGVGQLHAEHQHRHLGTGAAHHALADFHRHQLPVDGRVGAAATRIAHRRRALEVVAGGQ